jgi:signal transduction histidine kinase
MFALHAGIAMERARLHEQVQRLAVFDERDRISRELHDSVIQMIYGVTLSLDDVPEMVATAPDEAGQRVDEAIDALNGVIRDIRHFIFGLRPLLLDSGSLNEGLRSLAGELQRNTATEIAIHGEAPEDLPLATVADLLAVAREALANVARHAKAQHASLTITTSDDEISLEIADDGQGMDLDRPLDRSHNGLANMRARADALSGTFSVESSPGAGTRIIVRVPKSVRGATP